MDKMERAIRSVLELESEAADFVSTLSPRREGATLITLSGELGAGKTAFTKAVAKVLGVEDVVTSPTFVLEKIYTLPPRCAFRRLVHIDAYRLERGSELAALGFDELAKDPENLVLLEWPEKVADRLPKSSVSITITAVSDNERVLAYG